MNNKTSKKRNEERALKLRSIPQGKDGRKNWVGHRLWVYTGSIAVVRGNTGAKGNPEGIAPCTSGG